jgi:alkylhydroperoxidase/carboxymuconolactone decarboxylase family protein YurZ
MTDTPQPMSWRDALIAVSPDTMKRIGTNMLVAGAGRDGPVSPKVQSLLFLGVDSVVTHLYSGAVPVHLRGAIAQGATLAEVVEVLRIASTVSTRGYGEAIDALLDVAGLSIEAARAALSPTSLTAGEIDGFRAAIVAKAGYWPATLDTALAATPDYVIALLDLLHVPDDAPSLDTGTRALIGMALSSCPAINDTAGVRAYAQVALDAGVPLAALVQALQLVAGIGIHGITAAAPALADAFTEQSRPPQ